MQNKSKLRLGVAAAFAVVAVSLGVAAPVSADPTPAGTIKPLVGVGSDTTENLLNGLSTVVTNLGSYDATGSSQIQTRTGGPLFNRPNGSGSGQKALTASINPNGTDKWPAGTGVDITGQVDFARSSSAPSGSLPGTQLTFVPFARDAVSFAVSAASDFPRDIALGSASQDSISKLAETAPQPQACDKRGSDQCLTGTGGAAGTATAPTSGGTGASSASGTGTGSGAGTGSGLSSGLDGAGIDLAGQKVIAGAPVELPERGIPLPTLVLMVLAAIAALLAVLLPPIIVKQRAAVLAGAPRGPTSAPVRRPPGARTSTPRNPRRAIPRVHLPAVFRKRSRVVPPPEDS